MNQPVDILILSNGPGELATWVKPVVRELRQQLGNDRAQVRISLVLSPCANASGQEVAIARCYPEIDRIQAAAHFFPFLLFGKTQAHWDWRKHGVVLFLGGDQFFPLVIGKRLGYRTVIYAEWEARWQRWINRFGVMNPEIRDRASAKYAHKFTVVGDLMLEAREKEGNGIQDESIVNASLSPQPSALIGLLPGSKPMKLRLGVPYVLAIADRVQQQHPTVEFVIPVAPTLDLPTLAAYADPERNPVIERFGWATGTLVMPAEGERSLPYLKTAAGIRVHLWTEFPAYNLLTKCDLCVTTVGANTAELGALAVPMIVLLPTHELDAMRAWDGIPGLLVNLPGVGSSFARLLNRIEMRQRKLLAWPNIWAQTEIVPELIGRFEPEAIAAKVLHYLDHPAELTQMHHALQSVRGEPGAAKKLVQLVYEELQSL